MAYRLLLFIAASFFFVNVNGQTTERTTLNITTEDIANVKQKITKYDWASERWEKIKAIADEAAKDKSVIELPLRGGNWPHYYVDPEEGKPLVPGKYLGNWHWEHYNQARTKVYRGVDSIVSKDYDGVLIGSLIHDEWAKKLFAMALSYRVTGNKDCLDRIGQILAAYTKVYTKIPYHNKAGSHDLNYQTGGGRVGSQALDESVWMCKVLQALALIWDDLSIEQRSDVKTNLLYPAVDMIQHSYNLGIQNISCWYDAAVGMTGYLTENKGLIEWALREPNRGIIYQLDKGFSTDGHWYENSPSYHFYLLAPLVLLSETAKNHGDSTFMLKLNKVLNAPFQLMMPDKNLPRFNDCRNVYLPSFLEFYEYGYARFHNKNFLPIILEGRKFEVPKEASRAIDNKFNVFDYTLLYGNQISEAEAEDEESIPLQSLHLPNTGMDVLYSGTGKEAVWLATKYDVDRFKGWHLHPDELNFALFAKGRKVSMDPGMAEYGAPVHGGWYRSTLAHNTLVINQANQANRKGRNISFGEHNGIKYSFAATDSAYNGVSQTRGYLIVDSNTVIIADWIKSKKSALMDVSYHQKGTWKEKEKGVTWKIPDILGYKYLESTELVSSATQHYFSTIVKGENAKGKTKKGNGDTKEVGIQILASHPVSVITGIGNGEDFEPTPYMISRYEGKDLFLLTVIDLNGKKKDVSFELIDKSNQPKVKVNLGGKEILISGEGAVE